MASEMKGNYDERALEQRRRKLGQLVGGALLLFLGLVLVAVASVRLNQVQENEITSWTGMTPELQNALNRDFVALIMGILLTVPGLGLLLWATIEGASWSLLTNVRLECVADILRRHLDEVDVSADFLEGDKEIRLPNGTWLRIELRYSNTTGLTVDRISESENIMKDSYPSYDSFKEAKQKYINDPYVKGLLQKINDDIKRNC
jgi:hypothetical protein